MTERSWFKRLSALGLVVVLGGIVAVALTMFAGGFTPKVPVTVVSPRSGLVMDPDAKVKMRGVEVGRVKSITVNPDDAVLSLDMQPQSMSLIPANATVDIRSTTVFGAKYVNFIPPPNPSSNHLAPGATITADAVTVEFNTLFQHLSDVLEKLEPEKLNATLGALSTALRGRGDELGQVLSDSDAYLAKMNPSLPALQHDINAASEVTNIYADTAPDLLRVLSNASITSGTVVNEQNNLDSLLLNVIGLANTAGGVLDENEHNLTTAIDVLRSPTTMLNQYNPVLYCLVVGLDNARPIGEAVEGGLQEAITLNTGFVYGQDPYKYPDSLPKVNASGGPNCAGLPDRTPQDKFAPFIVTDNANVPYVPNTQLRLNAPKVFQVLFGELTPVPGGR